MSNEKYDEEEIRRMTLSDDANGGAGGADAGGQKRRWAKHNALEGRGLSHNRLHVSKDLHIKRLV